MSELVDLVVPCPRGTEALLCEELAGVGLADAVAGFGHARVHGDYAAALTVCLWSRIASRVLWPIGVVEAADAEALYAAVRELAIEEHLDLGRSFAIDLSLGQGTAAGFPHSQFAMLRVKDAIVDRLRDRRGARPDVDREHPDLRIHVHVAHGRAELAIDLAGDALHRRGYRQDGRTAPIKENLAAALLLAMGWPARTKRGEPFCDPMCGSGTIVIEAAAITGDRAPGLQRARWGFAGWSRHEERLWAPLISEARARARAGLKALDEAPPALGFDADGEAVAAAERNAVVAGLRGRVRCAVAALGALVAPEGGAGLIVTNPPYGERLGDEDALPTLYRELGDVLRRRFAGWTAGVITALGPLVGAIGLRPAKKTILWNGAIECRLLELPISSVHVASDDGPAWRKVSAASEQFANRLAKNLRHLGKWTRREGVSCFRAYDADLPEYSVAVDVYEGVDEAGGERQRWAHVQEYAAPATVDAGMAKKRLADVLVRTAQVLELPPERVIEKLRRRQRPEDQYEASGRGSARIVVEEDGKKFLVNLHDYLDTGLFLDQRVLRRMIASSAAGKDFLNLFSYTGSASVYAALAGAKSTTSVDLSNTYLGWAEDNFRLNGLPVGPHRVVQDDCVRWLEVAAQGAQRWGTILFAPPTFSNSKRMQGTLDLQRDHTALLEACARLLTPDGAIYFVNHFRRFKMAAPPSLHALELSRKTLPPDYARDARFHNSWKLRPV